MRSKEEWREQWLQCAGPTWDEFGKFIGDIQSDARRAAIEEAARDMCMYCGGRALPMDYAAHVAHGPNKAGNYVHHVSPNIEKLCPATLLHAKLHALAETGTPSATEPRQPSQRDIEALEDLDRS